MRMSCCSPNLDAGARRDVGLTEGGDGDVDEEQEEEGQVEGPITFGLPAGSFCGDRQRERGRGVSREVRRGEGEMEAREGVGKKS